MNFLKIHVLLKQLKRGVQPPAYILDEAIEFVGKYKEWQDFLRRMEEDGKTGP